MDHKDEPKVFAVFSVLFFSLFCFLSSGSAEPVLGRVESYTVQDDDSILGISQKEYSDEERGRGAHWLSIYAYNVELESISDTATPITLYPSGLSVRIEAGQVLEIPHYLGDFPTAESIILRFGVRSADGSAIADYRFDPVADSTEPVPLSPDSENESIEAPPDSEAVAPEVAPALAPESTAQAEEGSPTTEPAEAVPPNASPLTATSTDASPVEAAPSNAPPAATVNTPPLEPSEAPATKAWPFITGIFAGLDTGFMSFADLLGFHFSPGVRVYFAESVRAIDVFAGADLMYQVASAHLHTMSDYYLNVKGGVEYFPFETIVPVKGMERLALYGLLNLGAGYTHDSIAGGTKNGSAGFLLSPVFGLTYPLGPIKLDLGIGYQAIFVGSTVKGNGLFTLGARYELFKETRE